MGKSGNIELYPLRRKIGGNGPILAMGLIAGGQQVRLAGALGSPEIEPIFHPLKEKCEALYSFAESGHSDAIEFNDGKVIFGKMAEIKKISAEKVLASIPSIEKVLDEADLIASVNWTMLPMMNRLWEILLQQYTPRLSGKTRYFFVDLADPEKRTDADLVKALSLLKQLERHFKVILGLNLREAERVSKSANIPPSLDQQNGVQEWIKKLQHQLGLSQVILHSARFATDGKFYVQGPFTDKPLLKTGAGDNFNAGYLNGILYGFDPELCLLSGMYTAGYYVREGKSPEKQELISFLGGKKN